MRIDTMFAAEDAATVAVADELTGRVGRDTQRRFALRDRTNRGTASQGGAVGQRSPTSDRGRTLHRQHEHWVTRAHIPVIRFIWDSTSQAGTNGPALNSTSAIISATTTSVA